MKVYQPMFFSFSGGYDQQTVRWQETLVIKHSAAPVHIPALSLISIPLGQSKGSNWMCLRGADLHNSLFVWELMMAARQPEIQ